MIVTIYINEKKRKEAVLEELQENNGDRGSPTSLCMCETLVHCDKSVIPSNMYFAEMEIPDSFIPNEFTTVEENEESCHAGTLWLKSKKTVAIKVPSIILPSEYDRDFNIILNPEHPDFHLLKIKTVVECPFDLRLF